MLEKNLHAECCFITLTYEDGHLPISATGYPTLVPLHLRHWLGRLRAAIAPLKIRYYAVGEYGDLTFRPHYHAAVFGMPMCLEGRTKKDVRTNRPLAEKCCAVCRLVYQTWGKGDVDLGELNTESAQYVAQYTTKKMTNKNDERLDGRHPEFARMSLKPGIGADFMHEIGSTLLEFDLAEKQGDVPSSLRHGTRIMPLGRYLRGKLRETQGMDKKAPQCTIDEAQQRLQPLREAARASTETPSFKQQVIKAADESVKQMENKSRIYKRRNVL